jgi:uncharacterized membrane protein (DUF4010 family)
VLAKTANLQAKWNFLYIYDSIKTSLLVALALGCMWVLFVQCLPRGMSAVVTVLSIFTLTVLGVLAFAGKINGASPALTLLTGFLLIGTAVLFACFLCFYRLRNKLISIFLDWSSRFFK